MASKYLKRFQVPNNFENILSDFAKEILRNQPKDIKEKIVQKITKDQKIKSQILLMRQII